MNEGLISAIEKYQSLFGLTLDDSQIARLVNFYDVVQEFNPLLHLVAPCSAEEFAVRHILESLTLLEYLPLNAKFADVGTGAGLPSLPCLLAREDIHGLLIESKEKKARYLAEAVNRLGLNNRVKIVNKQFRETGTEGVDFVTCRALDRYSEHLATLVKWSKGKKLLLFGGKDLGERLQEARVKCVQKLLPLSEQRYLYISNTQI
ncbi:MAG: 16S rRNA (guanine(527)-N(7))-methyltransferase RsmG [Acidobacteria bacterium]|nr:16S rRNA (guanine(527)-N(7))-methyltransferase RsmG [Acidobacteriota bacterium]